MVSQTQQRLKIKEVYAGMKTVTTLVKVIQKYEVREFSKGDNKGKVCSLFVGDETGVTRLVFWNEQVDQLIYVNENDILLVKDAYARDNNGRKEIHMGRNGTIDINPEGEAVEVVRKENNFSRKSIQELNGGEDSIEIMGTIVQVFDPRFFYLCSECNKRAMESEEGYNCAQHGKVSPVLSYVMNLVLDDGTGNIRSVLWKNQTNNLLKKTEEDLSNFKNDMTGFENIKNDLLGEQVILLGRVKKNEMFDRLEFNVQIVNKADPQKEVAKLESVN